MKRRLLPFLLSTLIIMGGCSGCQSDPTADRSITLEIEESIQNLDPQVASTTGELSVVYNCFEGLMRTTETGEVVCGAAASYEPSSDGKTFTFTLRDDLTWSDGSSVTADDFVFGLQRALLPQTKCPGMEALLPIQNASAVFTGAADASQLGVSAPDEQTVVIRLESTQADFLRALTQSASFPCNREFFKQTGGKYGLATKYLLCNGPFSLKSWEEGKILQLNRRKQYDGPHVAKAATVRLVLNGDVMTRTARIQDGSLDVGFIPQNQMESAKALPSLLRNSVTNCVYLNPNAKTMTDTMRKALLQAVDREQISIVLPSYWSETVSLIPVADTVQGKTLSGQPTLTEYDPSAAKEAYANVLSLQKRKNLPDTTLYYPESEDYRLIANYIAQSWQKNLGAFINTKGVSATELASMVKKGSVAMALLPLSAQDDLALTFLKQFKPDGIYPLGDRTYAALVNEINGQTDLTIAQSVLRQAEQRLLNTKTLYPLFCSPVFYAYGSTVSGLTFFAGTGILDFSNLGKTA